MLFWGQSFLLNLIRLQLNCIFFPAQFNYLVGRRWWGTLSWTEEQTNNIFKTLKRSRLDFLRLCEMTGSHSGSFKSLISVWFGADISARVITSRPSDHEGSVSSFTESHGVIRNIASSWMLIVLLLVNLAVCPSASPSMIYSYVCWDYEVLREARMKEEDMYS